MRLKFVKSTSGYVIAGHVDAELRDGTAISWLLDVTWTDQLWTVEAGLARSTGKGQENTSTAT
jgi:hypothetical protein